MHFSVEMRHSRHRRASPVGRGFGPAWRTLAAKLLLVVGLFSLSAEGSLSVRVAAQMPDVRAMSGLAIPSPDLPDGTVTVRVVRENIANNLPDIDVELHGAGPVRTAKTGADGRARFEGVPAGAAVRAAATVAGERLTSSEFQVPARGGVRTLLAAGLVASGAPPTAPPPSRDESPSGKPSAGVRGLSIGPNSRIVLEFADDVLQVFYLLEIVNGTGKPVQPSAPLTLELPDVAAGATILEGSSKQATARARQVSIAGPFTPGMTSVQIAYRIERFGDTLTLNQAFPLPFQMPMTAVQKVGEMRVSSPQIARTQEIPIQNNTFIMGTGATVPVGTPLTLTIRGLPHHSRTPLSLALLLAAVIVGVGVWLAWSPAHATVPGVDRQSLENEQQERLAALGALEAAHTAGRLDSPGYQARRAELIAELERIYAALDENGGDERRDVA